MTRPLLVLALVGCATPTAPLQPPPCTAAITIANGNLLVNGEDVHDGVLTCRVRP